MTQINYPNSEAVICGFYLLLSFPLKLISGSVSLPVLREKFTLLTERSDNCEEELFHKDENEILFSGSPQNTSDANTGCRGFKTD